MNTRLKIICILFALAYLFVIGDTCVQLFSFDMPEEYSTQDAYELGYAYGNKVREGLVPAAPFWGLIFPTIVVALLFILSIGLLIYIPIQTYKVIRSIVRDEIFDPHTTQRIRRIGYACLVTFLINIPLFSLTQYLYYAFLDIQDLSQYGSIRDDYSLLLIGLLVLLFAEVLKISHSIKEEHDLTV